MRPVMAPPLPFAQHRPDALNRCPKAPDLKASNSKAPDPKAPTVKASAVKAPDPKAPDGQAAKLPVAAETPKGAAAPPAARPSPTHLRATISLKGRDAPQ